MNIPSSSAAAIAAPAAPTAAEREVKLTAWLIVAALLAGFFLQVWIPPGGVTLVASAGLAGLVAVAVSFVAPGRLRETLAGFRFISTLLFVLAVFAVLGTLVLQAKPAAFYVERYGLAGKLVVALRLDDVFHGLPFALVMALFGASVISSASLRWPPTLRKTGFFLCHVGLLTSLGGAAASAALALRGRIDLHAGGEHATHVRLTKAGAPSGEYAALGFDLHLERFDLVNYETEYRVAYYEQKRVRDSHDAREHDHWKLVASFDPDAEKHRLPNGDSFRLKGIYPEYMPISKAVRADSGPPALEVTLGGMTQWLAPGQMMGSPDRRVAVAFGWERPTPPPGIQTVVLVSGAERKVVVHRADGQAEQPLSEGLALLGGAVKLGTLHEHASIAVEHGTASAQWRNPAVLVEVQQKGLPREQLMLAARPGAVMLAPTRALVFEKRDKEVKAYISHVAAQQGSTLERRSIAVNDPMTFSGWTLYQVNYNPEDPSYSGLEAVYDPGVLWVFTGFALICLGVFWMFYVEPRLKKKAAVPSRA